MRFPSPVCAAEEREQTTQAPESETPMPPATEESSSTSEALRRGLPSLTFLAAVFLQSDLAGILGGSSGIGRGHAA